jgi:hypothetical protein
LALADALTTINDVLCDALSKIHLVILPCGQSSAPRDICHIR